MLLRMLVANWIQQNAKQKIYDAVADAVAANQSSGRRGDPAPGDPTDATGSAEPPEIAPCEVAVLFALGLESAGLTDLLTDKVSSQCATFTEHDGFINQRRILVVETGVGQPAARTAAEDILATHRPAWLISAGFAGALHDDLRRGHILMADSVGTEDGLRFDVHLGVRRESIVGQRSLHIGRLLTVDRLIRDGKEKRSLGQQHQALACDMETAAVAAACQRAKTRFLSIRIITDGVDDQLPPEIEHLMDQKSLASKLGAAAGAIFSRPSSIKDMWNLREEALKATDRLAKFLVGVVEQLR